ncbi:coilin isoform X2 [Hyperolius riggenbachi]|uniref:coilin isoform X2 n=1 Tax=Hyperolius riggenbachi TaxID=752182 RepID=UPI0035A38A0D
MAAEEVRVKLEFDYPPPAVPESRHVWMLVRREECRAVTDLSCLLRERFYPHHKGAPPPRLYVQECLLPPGESIRVLREGDLIRVKFDAHSAEDHETGSDNQSRPPKKRRWHKAEDNNEEECFFTPKHKKQKPQDPQSANTHQKDKKKSWKKMIPEDGTLEESTETYRKKLNKQTVIPEGRNSEESSEGSSKISKVIPEKMNSEVSSEKKKRKKKRAVLEQTDPEESSKRKKQKKVVLEQRDSEGSSEIPTKKVHKKKGKPKKQVSEDFSSIKEIEKNLSPAKANCEPQAKKLRARSSSDSSTSSSDDEPVSIKKVVSLVPETSASNVSVTVVTSDVSMKSTTKNLNLGKSFVSSTEQSCSTETPSQVLDDSSIRVTLTKNSGTSSSVVKNKENSSSSESDSSEDDAKKPRSATAPHLNGASNGHCEGDDSSSSDSDTFVIKKPIIPSFVTTNGNVASGVQQGPLPKPDVLGHGRGRGRDNPLWRGQGGRGFRGQGNQNRGRGNPNQFFYNYDPQMKEQQLDEPATNVSIIIQNPPEPARKDYSTLPLLAAPPQVGKCIAFKLLELTDNYTPEVSDYKEGRILSFDPVTQQLELQLLGQQQSHPALEHTDGAATADRKQCGRSTFGAIVIDHATNCHQVPDWQQHQHRHPSE